jgi:tetratricopeptide (TPR) repeat protein
MNDLVRAELIERLNQPTAPALTTAAQTKTAYEPTGFTAHAVRHGRACYKAGRYEDALVILGGAIEISGAHFWIACSLEKLGRTEEAIAAYESVMQSPQDSKHAVDAEWYRDDLIWRRDFDPRISTTAAVVMPGDSK